MTTKVTYRQDIIFRHVKTQFCGSDCQVRLVLRDASIVPETIHQSSDISHLRDSVCANANTLGALLLGHISHNDELSEYLLKAVYKSPVGLRNWHVAL